MAEFMFGDGFYGQQEQCQIEPEKDRERIVMNILFIFSPSFLPVAVKGIDIVI